MSKHILNCEDVGVQEGDKQRKVQEYEKQFEQGSVNYIDT